MNENDDTDIKQEDKKLELERFQFEKKKFTEELRTERIKTVATALSIIIPVIVAGWTINSNLTLQANQAKYDFSLKVVDIVMSAKTPAGTEARAKVLRDLFPNYFEKDFLKPFNASEYSASKSENIRIRKDQFFQTLLEETYMDQGLVVYWWEKLYPEDTWLNITLSNTSQNEIYGPREFYPYITHI
jgi:hypothetical protein